MNILVFLTDQQQRGSLGVYGNPTVMTPNLDRLAASSAVFESAVCAQPVCVPSRCSLWTGTWPHTHGVIDNYHALPRRFPTMAETLIERGVRTGYLGKLHLDARREVIGQRGFEEFYRAVDDDYTSNGDFPLFGLSGYGRWLVEKGYAPDSMKKPGRFSRDFTSRLPEEHGKAAFISGQACRFLEQRRHEPFFLVCSFLEPHNPYHSPYDDLHDPREIPLPANFHAGPLPGWPERTALFQRWAREIAVEDGIAYDSEEKWRALIARYYGMCHLVDRHAGRVLDTLDELGLADDTLVVYTSDHGDMMGAHGMYMKSMMYEESQGVPLIIRMPGGRAGRLREPVNLVDLVPTLLDALGVEIPGHAQGKSFLPLLRGARDEDPDAFTVCEWNGVVQKTFSKHDFFDGATDRWIRSVRTRRWKFNVNPGDISELYDLENDPGEMKNLIADQARRSLVEDLFGKLCRWQENNRDPLILRNPFSNTGCS